jgi:hypothetical protein
MEPKVKLKACITVASIVLYLPLAVNAQLSPANANGASGSIHRPPRRVSGAGQCPRSRSKGVRPLGRVRRTHRPARYCGGRRS